MGNYSSHSTGHFLTVGAVRDGVRMFRQYIHSVFWRMYASKFGRKMLALAYWVTCVDPRRNEEYQAYETIFSLEADNINQILGQITADLGDEVKLKGSLSDALRVHAPSIRQVQ